MSNDLDAILGLASTPRATVGGRPRTKGTGRQRKLECPLCGFLCYASAGAVARAGMPTCGCGGAMIVPHFRDLAKIDPDAGAELEESAESAELEREARRAMRDGEREANYGFTTGAASCGVCGRFKSRPSSRCDHCGDEPSMYGATDAETRAAERIHDRGAGYGF